MGVDGAATAQGVFTGTAQVRVAPDKTIPVEHHLERGRFTPLADSGDSMAKNLSRLRWLDSTVGSEANADAAVHRGAGRRRRVIKVLGRELALGEDGLPARIISHFSPANTRIEEAAREVLARPADFVVETSAGPVSWQSKFETLAHTDLEANWTARSTGGRPAHRNVRAASITPAPAKCACAYAPSGTWSLRDARLEVPFREDVARYFMGLHQQGGRRPRTSTGNGTCRSGRTVSGWAT